jgi:hypothetical protein
MPSRRKFSKRNPPPENHSSQTQVLRGRWDDCCVEDFENIGTDCHHFPESFESISHRPMRRIATKSFPLGVLPNSYWNSPKF